jgi:cation:H+ antiporter
VAPALLIADRTLHVWEGLLLVVLYLVLFISLSRRESLYEKILERFNKKKTTTEHRFIKITTGVSVILLASTYMVNTAEYFATTFNWSPFVVGLVIIALGTNIPELSLVLRSAISGKSEIALADYIGSAAANSLLIGVFAIISSGGIKLPSQAWVRIVILLSSLVLFYIFIRSEKKLTRRESFIFILIFVIFLLAFIGQA